MKTQKDFQLFPTGFDFTRDKSKSIAEHLTGLVKDGVMSLEQIARLQKLHRALKGFFEEKVVKQNVLHSIGGGPLTIYGLSISKTTANVRYDFDGCNHPGLKAAYELQNQVNEYIKNLETELKAIPAGETRNVVVEKVPAGMTFEESGELATITGPVRSSSETVQFKE